MLPRNCPMRHFKRRKSNLVRWPVTMLRLGLLMATSMSTHRHSVFLGTTPPHSLLKAQLCKVMKASSSTSNYHTIQMLQLILKSGMVDFILSHSMVSRSLTVDFIFYFSLFTLFFFFFFLFFSIFRTTWVRVYQSRCHISHKLMAKSQDWS